MPTQKTGAAKPAMDPTVTRPLTQPCGFCDAIVPRIMPPMMAMSRAVNSRKDKVAGISAG